MASFQTVDKLYGGRKITKSFGQAFWGACGFTTFRYAEVGATPYFPTKMGSTRPSAEGETRTSAKRKMPPSRSPEGRTSRLRREVLGQAPQVLRSHIVHFAISIGFFDKFKEMHRVSLFLPVD